MVQPVTSGEGMKTQEHRSGFSLFRRPDETPRDAPTEAKTAGELDAARLGGRCISKRERHV